MLPSSLWLSAAFVLASVATSQVTSDLVGTWTTKSGKVITGPGFYDPITEKIFEPDLTGISYSFSADGHYEEALYRALPNPVNPACPGAVVQWQHGTFTESANTTLVLTPFAIDGRQLLSEPCNYDTSIFSRYNRSEFFTKYEIYTDTYNNRLRLDLYQWDGTPHNPMWLAYRPPEMLPTQTLHPAPAASGVMATGTGGKKIKRATGVAQRSWEKKLEPLNRTVVEQKTINAARWFWYGLGMTGVGGVLYMSF